MYYPFITIFTSPQKYHDNIWNLLSTLEFFFGSVVEAELVVTPRGCTGTKSESVNGDTFIVQLEGRSRFSVSSPSDVILEGIVDTGGVLYCPPGTSLSHESCQGDDDSVLLYVITNINNNIKSLLELLLPQAIGLVSKERAGVLEAPLPSDFLDSMYYLATLCQNLNIIFHISFWSGLQRR